MDIQFGVIFGFALVAAILISLIAAKGYHKDKKVKEKYDERQKAIRGKAFKYGFYTMVFANCACMLLHCFGLAEFMGFYAYFASIILGIIVQVTYSIFKDAYVGMNTSLRKYIIYMSFISIVNICAAIHGIVSGEMFEGGVLQDSFMNLLCSILFVVLVIDLLIKRAIDKKEN